jgi:hypothetical protein
VRWAGGRAVAQAGEGWPRMLHSLGGAGPAWHTVGLCKGVLCKGVCWSPWGLDTYYVLSIVPRITVTVPICWAHTACCALYFPGASQDSKGVYLLNTYYVPGITPRGISIKASSIGHLHVPSTCQKLHKNVKASSLGTYCMLSTSPNSKNIY